MKYDLILFTVIEMQIKTIPRSYLSPQIGKVIIFGHTSVGVWRDRCSHTVLMGVWSGTTSMTNDLGTSIKITNAKLTDPAIYANFERDI